MPNVNETIYPTLDSRYSEKSLAINFTSNSADTDFVRSRTKYRQTQSLLLVLLKVTQHLFYVPKPSEIPYCVIRFICTALGVAKLKKSDLNQYQHSRTFDRHAKWIREYLQLNNSKKHREMLVEPIGISFAQSKGHLVDIINALIESMVNHQIELPPFPTVKRMAIKCRNQANKLLFDDCYHSASPLQVTQIEGLFQTDKEKSLWQQLKENPDKPTHENIKEFISRLIWLKSFAEKLPSINLISLSRLEQLRYEAMSMHINKMLEIDKRKRITLALILVKTQLTQALDDLTDMFIRVIASVQAKGRALHSSDVYDQRAKPGKLVGDFAGVLNAYQDSTMIDDPKKRMVIIDDILRNNANNWLTECESYLNLNRQGDKPHTIDAYRSKRRLIFRMISVLPIRSTRPNKNLIPLLNILKVHYGSKDEFIHHRIPDYVVSQLGSNWLRAICTEKDGCYHRSPLEAATFLGIANGLKTFRYFIEGSEKYCDPNKPADNLG